MALTITRRAGERLVVQTDDANIVISASSRVVIRVDAPKAARVMREELAEICDVCGRWTLRGPCEWCNPDLAVGILKNS